jgi:hypothetical protein
LDKENVLSKLEKLVRMCQDKISSLQSAAHTLEEKVALQPPTPRAAIRRPGAIPPKPAMTNQVGTTDLKEIKNLEITAGALLAIIRCNALPRNSKHYANKSKKVIMVPNGCRVPKVPFLCEVCSEKR